MKKLAIRGTICSAGGGGAYVLLPIDPEKVFGKKNMIPVNILFDNQIAYQGRIANMGQGPMIPVLKSIRAALNKNFGDEIAMEIALDTSERKVTLPQDLIIALKDNGLLTPFEKLSYTHQKEHVRWIEDAKKDETRKTRIAKTIQNLLSKS
jgi:Bacteriocin-protection, YdeI or OmpD-Associated/Domain of unknown function (DUF1905)